MENISFKFKIALLFAAATFLAIFITRPAYSQETEKKESHKKIIMKIVSDDNGKTTVIDTTMDLTDSFLTDSIQREIDKVLMLSKGGKHARFKIHNMPEEFNYDFKFPCVPECPIDLDELDDSDWEGMASDRDMADCCLGRISPGCERRIIRSGGNGQTLNDILGEIPMDRVVSYSIKDHKNGKRIIIDLNDAPMFEGQNRVIVIRDPGKKTQSRNHPGHQVKVSVSSDDDSTTVEGSSGQSVPPAATPSAQPNKKSPK